mmetsp:Transcript_110113/g.318294  ORF Transcript_110113/g.318294 Transcript_110113/m.318294 type:complete len:100 (-) Transcript_110113:301-600(-)
MPNGRGLCKVLGKKKWWQIVEGICPCVRNEVELSCFTLNTRMERPTCNPCMVDVPCWRVSSGLPTCGSGIHHVKILRERLAKQDSKSRRSNVDPMFRSN